jgi:hypothetical protein
VGHKPPELAIFLRVERVMTDLERERMMREHLTNQMIDIGVRMTKDQLLKQSTVLNNFGNLRI